jgi:preprotein translocase subunit YajC
MSNLRRNKSGFTVVEILLSTFVVLVVIAAGFFVFNRRPTNKSTNQDKTITLVQGNTVTLVGKITSANCPGIPDAGCSIVVNGYSIPIVHGFINTPHLGTVTGDSHNLVGKTAHVYAERIDSKDASIFDSSKYYVHISK